MEWKRNCVANDAGRLIAANGMRMLQDTGE